jgi:hypothetical protein
MRSKSIIFIKMNEPERSVVCGRESTRVREFVPEENREERAPANKRIIPKMIRDPARTIK